VSFSFWLDSGARTLLFAEGKKREECRALRGGGVQPPRHSVLFAAGELSEPPKRNPTKALKNDYFVL